MVLALLPNALPEWNSDAVAYCQKIQQQGQSHLNQMHNQLSQSDIVETILLELELQSGVAVEFSCWPWMEELKLAEAESEHKFHLVEACMWA